MTDYEKEYQRASNVCGKPFPEFASFFESAPKPFVILDLGCGQGRDALVAARFGHSVIGVDRAPSGVSQMSAIAAAEGLPVTGIVADIEEYQADTTFDVVILDRILHMLPSEDRRLALLERACAWIRVGGFALIADTPSNREMIAAYFRNRGWPTSFRRADFLFAKHPAVSPRHV